MFGCQDEKRSSEEEREPAEEAWEEKSKLFVFPFEKTNAFLVPFPGKTFNRILCFFTKYVSNSIYI